MQEKKKLAIEVDNVQKIYKLYDKPSDRMKEAFGFGKKTKHKLHYALKGVDMKIYQGETVGIIGTNGSGKSTILKIITGVLNPTSGRVLVNGRISALLELGAGFNMEYNGIENVYLNGTMMGFSEKEIEAKLPEILSFADIGDYVYQPVKTYSSGMFVRLAFAVAINIEPEILIVDEALSVGDVFFQAKCYHKFEEFTTCRNKCSLSSKLFIFYNQMTFPDFKFRRFPVFPFQVCQRNQLFPFILICIPPLDRRAIIPDFNFFSCCRLHPDSVSDRCIT